MHTFKNSTVLITGGLGFLGCNLVHKLLKSDVKEIYIIDNLSSGNKNFLPDDKRVIFNYCDISNYEKYVKIFPKKVDYVFHLAAHFANQNSVEHPLSDVFGNVVGTTNTLNICKDVGIKKLIYTSSSCVYGNHKNMNENLPVYPTETPYAINKLCAEMYVKYFAELHNLPTLSIRIFNTFGPFELPGRYRNVIPNFIDLALDNKPLTITGTGEETRDFTYVDDTIDLMISMCLSEHDDGSVYNGGTGKSISISQLAETIIKYTKSSSKIIYKPRRDWDLVTDRLSDINKSENTFNYKPSVSFDDGIKKTIEWLMKKDNKFFNFWKDIWDSKGVSDEKDLLTLGGWDNVKVEVNSGTVSDGIKNLLNYKNNNSILEVGCGIGFLSKEFDTSKYVGIDYSESLIEKHKSLFPKHRVSVSEANKLPFNDNEFDYTFCCGLFQYLPNEDYADEVIEEMIRVSKKSILIVDLKTVKTDDKHFIYPKDKLINRGFTFSNCIYNQSDESRCNAFLKIGDINNDME